jgi:hypothetical protein
MGTLTRNTLALSCFSTDPLPVVMYLWQIVETFAPLGFVEVEHVYSPDQAGHQSEADG